MFLQSTFQVNLLSELLRQGPTVAGLMLAIWYFYSRQTKLENKLDAATEKYERHLSEDLKKMVEVIENNTHTMEENSRIIQELQQNMK